MATLIAVSNQKGGCGKTTTAMNLAGGLTKAKYRVLVIDADEQASATIWSLAQGQGSLPFEVQTSRQVTGKLRDLLLSNEYDIILVDCPPGIADDPKSSSAIMARAAMLYADAILVPLRPSTLDFSAAATLVRMLAKEKRADTQTLVLINCKRNTLLDRQARDHAAVLFAPIQGARVLETTIGLRAPITEVSGSGKTIFEYAPSHEAATEYRNLTREIIQCLTNAAPALQPTTSAIYTSSSPNVTA